MNVTVNVCWFASLILSLSTASVTILVKQWLREYLSVDYTVPHERIRIRHFRYHGLESWKLLEIAALLPLMILVSLGLFFVGLCFFTASVHPSIGKTAVVLVGGWALFTVFALIAPILSPRCPYKTTSLKYPSHVARSQFRQLTKSCDPVYQYIQDYMSRRYMNVSCIRSSVQTRTATILQSVSSLLRSLAPEIPLHSTIELLRRPFRNLRRTTNDTELMSEVIHHDDPLALGHTLEDSETPSSEERSEEPQVGCWKLSTDSAVLSTLVDNPEKIDDGDETAVWDENEVRRTSVNDIAIFETVDSLLLDDDLLQTTRAAIQARPPSGEAILKFTVGLLNRRFASSEGPGRNSSEASDNCLTILDLRHIPQTTHEPIVGILGDAIMRELKSIPAEQWIQALMPSDSWSYRAFLLLVTLCPREIGDPIPQAATAVFARLLSVDTLGYGCAILANNIAEDDVLNHDKHGLVRVLMSVTDALRTSTSTHMAYAFKCIIHWHLFGLDEDVGDETETFEPILQQCRQRSETMVSSVSLTIFVDTSLVLLWAAVDTAESHNHPSNAFLKIHTELLRFTIDATPIIEEILPLHNFAGTQISGGVTLERLLTRMLTTPSTIPLVLECFSTQIGVLLSTVGRVLFVDGYSCDHLLLGEHHLHQAKGHLTNLT